MQERITLDDECGSSKSCFQDCNAGGCKFIVSWINDKDHVTFNIRASLQNLDSQWIAIAFSEDDKMVGTAKTLLLFNISTSQL